MMRNSLKTRVLYRSVASLLSVFICLAATFKSAFAGGSIVINASQPASELVYREDTGNSKSLKVTWTDIQLMDSMRRFLIAKFGIQDADQPFYIDRKKSKVSYFDPQVQDYRDVSFRELLRTQ